MVVPPAVGRDEVALIERNLLGVDSRLARAVVALTSKVARALAPELSLVAQASLELLHTHAIPPESVRPVVDAHMLVLLLAVDRPHCWPEQRLAFHPLRS